MSRLQSKNRQDRTMESVFPDTKNGILPSRAEDFRKYLWSLTSWRDDILGKDWANFLPIYPVLGFSPASHCRKKIRLIPSFPCPESIFCVRKHPSNGLIYLFFGPKVAHFMSLRKPLSQPPSGHSFHRI